MREESKSEAGSMIHWRFWDDFSELIDVVTDEDRCDEMAPRMMLIRQSRLPAGVAKGKHFGGESWEDSVQKLRSGWPEGAEQLRKIGVQIEHGIESDVDTCAPVYDVTGQCVDVGAYLSGAPECMITMEPRTIRGHGGILRILLNLDISNKAKTLHIMNRGAAIMAAIDLIEATQTRIEIYGYTGVGAIRANMQLVDVIRLKAPEDPLDVDRLSFALCNVNFCRRICMALFECRPYELQQKSWTELGKGEVNLLMCNVSGTEFRSSCDLSLTSPAHPGTHFDTFADARDWVIYQLRKIGFEVSARAAA